MFSFFFLTLSQITYFFRACVASSLNETAFVLELVFNYQKCLIILMANPVIIFAFICLMRLNLFGSAIKMISFKYYCLKKLCP